MSRCAEHPPIALHVAGALDESESLAVVEHLRRCQSCRDELAELARLERLLETARPEPSLVVELALFWRERAWWLGPFAAVVAGLGVLFAVAEGSAFAPFIYSIF